MEAVAMMQLDKIKNRAIRLIFNPGIMLDFPPLFIPRDIASLALFYKYFSRKCSEELASMCHFFASLASSIIQVCNPHEPGNFFSLHLAYDFLYSNLCKFHIQYEGEFPFSISSLGIWPQGSLVKTEEKHSINIYAFSWSVYILQDLSSVVQYTIQQ